MNPLAPYTPDPTAIQPIAAIPVPVLLILAVFLTVAVYVELKERRIPNWLTLPSMSLGLLFGFFHGTQALWSSVGGLAFGFGFLFIFYVFGGVGGGDVKMMGAAGALLGADLIKPALFYTTFFGAFLAVMITLWRKDFWTRLALNLQRLAFWRKRGTEPPAPLAPVTVPYGIAIAIGCLLALLVKGNI